ncbi:MAG: 3' terminal RNA ribose 2'-O-methyltransferase Hen1 [Verrucomicrobiota bacterium]
MLLTITAKGLMAEDLGYLVHKHPDKVQTFSLNVGKAHVFYPIVEPELCTLALLLEVDPVGLVRKNRGPAGNHRILEQYVNDRPYVASSFISVAIAELFGRTMSGKCKDKPELVDYEMDFTANIAALPCRRGGEAFLLKLFEPLGYGVKAQINLLDERFPEWGDSSLYTIELTRTCTIKELLGHLYILIPVLDNDKHYWVGLDEVEKLMKKGEGWLSAHPEKEIIVHRYLKYQKRLANQALSQLFEEDLSDVEEKLQESAQEESHFEDKISLNEQRIGAVVSALKSFNAKRVLDLGCGEGQLIKHLLKEKEFNEIVGMDVSHQSLERASDRLKIDRMPDKQKERIRLIQGSLMYRDKRLSGFDAAAVVEVIEHLDTPRLKAFERVLFEYACPQSVVMTTPNSEYNVKFEKLPAGQFRHRDHRFEWTRKEFQVWSNDVADRYKYQVRFLPVGPVDDEFGAPTQMAIFIKDFENEA